jgi:pilus assembly protein CpaF
VTIRDLFVDSLRMRPDRIVVGEVRRGEALDLIQSMISGHAGSLTTVHASTPRDAAIRLETLSLMSDVSLPVYVARAQVASALNIVIQIMRFGDGSRRVQKITEVLGLDAQNNYQFQDLYVFKAEGHDENGMLLGRLHPTGIRPTFAEEVHALGYGNRIRLTQDLFGPPPAASSPPPENAARNFDQDEDGMETMQVVMIIAVAAIVLLFVRQQWGHISNWADTLVGEITRWQG